MDRIGISTILQQDPHSQVNHGDVFATEYGSDLRFSFEKHCSVESSTFVSTQLALPTPCPNHNPQYFIRSFR